MNDPALTEAAARIARDCLEIAAPCLSPRSQLAAWAEFYAAARAGLERYELPRRPHWSLPKPSAN